MAEVANPPVENKEQSESKVAADFPQSHPLQNSWSMWYDAPQTGREWVDKLQKISTFSSVEDFWRLTNNLAPPSKLQIGSNYHMFKDGVRPAFEDPANLKGGKWNVLVYRNTNKTDALWLYTLLALIGEELDADDEVTGAVLSPRRAQDKLAVWTRNAANEEAVMAVGRRLRSLLDLDPSIKLEYQVHADAMQSSRGRPRYTA
eukprot:TRINITY_DN951_c0_g1_i1.p1 TRINITY_DN951_c0_g1~~TRINITY_DN951_c0_g1_i1.p1  ORF type:complete len:203 (+),score=49.46 TRINITY_DN951_c0_g1_i1:78-686(+)